MNEPMRKFLEWVKEHRDRNFDKDLVIEALAAMNAIARMEFFEDVQSEEEQREQTMSRADEIWNGSATHGLSVADGIIRELEAKLAALASDAQEDGNAEETGR